MKTRNDASETASDATNMFGIVRIRGFSIIARSVNTFPTNKNNKISTKTPVSRMTFSLLLDFNSFNMSASCFSAEESILGPSVLPKKGWKLNVTKMQTDIFVAFKKLIYYFFIITH